MKTASPVYESSPRSTEKTVSPRYQSPSPSGSEENQYVPEGIATKRPEDNNNISPGVKSNEKSPVSSRSPPVLAATATATATSPTSLNTSYSSSSSPSSSSPSPSPSPSPSSSTQFKRSESKLSSPTSPSLLASNKATSSSFSSSSFYTDKDRERDTYKGQGEEREREREREPLEEPVSPQQHALLQAEADMTKALQSHPAFSNENKSDGKPTSSSSSSASGKYSIFQQVLDSNEFKQKSGQNNSPPPPLPIATTTTNAYSHPDAVNVVRLSSPESPTIAEILSEDDNPENPEESFMTEIPDNISDTQSSNENMNLKDRIPEYQSIYGETTSKAKAGIGINSMAVAEMKGDEQDEEKKETLGRANIRRIGQVENSICVHSFTNIHSINILTF